MNLFQLFFKKNLELLLNISVVLGIIYSTILILNKLGIIYLTTKAFGDNFILQVWGHSSLANYLIFPIIYLFSTIKTVKLNLKTALLSIFSLCLLISFSRTSVATIFLTLLLFKTLSPVQKQLKWIYLTTLSLILVFFFSYIAISHNQFKSLTGSRPKYWLQGINGFIQHPLFGNGPETFYIINRKLLSVGQTGTNTTHNSILDFLSNNGIIFVTIFYSFIFISLAYQFKHRRQIFYYGFAGLFCSLFDPSWGFPGLFTISLIFIFYDSPYLFSTVPNRFTTRFILTLTTILLIFFISKTTSDILYAKGQYASSLRFDPFNLNSRIATITSDIPTTTKLFHNETLIYQALITSIPLPNSRDYYLKLIELDPQNNIPQLIALLNFANLQSDPTIFDSIEKLKLNISPEPLPHDLQLQLAKAYYFHALQLWDSDDKLHAIKYFSLAANYSDGYSHFYLELANAYWHSQQFDQALNTVTKCQQFPSSVNHCQKYLNSHQLFFEKPGYFKPSIKDL